MAGGLGVKPLNLQLAQACGVGATMSELELTIGSLAAETGSNVQTIRYYEQIGLMPVPVRTAGNQRRYGMDHVRRLTFIRNARDLGFPMETVIALLGLAAKPNRPCQEVIDIAEANLAVVRSRLMKLRALEKALKDLTQSCPGGRMKDCCIIEALSGPRR